MNYVDPTGHAGIAATAGGGTGGGEETATTPTTTTLLAAALPTILLDHNIAGPELQAALEKMGYSVKTLADIGLTREATDETIGKMATERGWYIMTKNFRDFIDLGFKDNLIKVGGQSKTAEVISRMANATEAAAKDKDFWTKSIPLMAKGFAPPPSAPDAGVPWFIPTFMLDWWNQQLHARES